MHTSSRLQDLLFLIGALSAGACTINGDGDDDDTGTATDPTSGTSADGSASVSDTNQTTATPTGSESDSDSDGLTETGGSGDTGSGTGLDTGSESGSDTGVADDSTGGTGGGDYAVCDMYAATLEGCGSKYTVEDNIAYCNTYLAGANAASPECGTAAEEFFACISQLDCAELETGCSEESAAVEAACPAQQ